MKLKLKEVDRLVDEHYANLYRFALSLVRNEAEAADLTQQTYFILATKGGQLRDLSKAKSWLFTTLHREFLALKRRTNRFADIDPADVEEEVSFEADSAAVRNADASVVIEALGKVRETFRIPLALFYLEDLSYKEIADILDVPIGTVMSRLSRGKNELRACLSEGLVALSQSPDNVIKLPKSAS